MEQLKESKKSFSYEIKKHLATLYEYQDYSVEVNYISWNHMIPKIDIRRWTKERPTDKGIALDGSESENLYLALRAFFEKDEGGPQSNSELDGYTVEDPDGISYKLYKNLGVLSKNDSGYTKEVNHLVWNHGNTKIDIRNWSPLRRCLKGISLDIQEAKILYHLLMDFYADLSLDADQISESGATE